MYPCSNPEETQNEVLRRRGICRRDFLKFCSMAAVALGLGPMGHLEIAHAMETKPYLPVLWINGLSCSCCTESFIRSAHPFQASDIIRFHHRAGLSGHHHGGCGRFRLWNVSKKPSAPTRDAISSRWKAIRLLAKKACTASTEGVPSWTNSSAEPPEPRP